MAKAVSIIKTVLRELREMVPPAIFFGLGFNALVETLQAMANDSGPEPTTHLAATLGALIVAKGVLLADMMPFLDHFARRRRILQILWKSTFYFLSTTLLHLLERTINAVRAPGGLASGFTEEAQAIDWSQFWIVQMWLAILIFSYTALMQMVRDLGHESVYQAFFSEQR